MDISRTALHDKRISREGSYDGESYARISLNFIIYFKINSLFIKPFIKSPKLRL